MRVFACAIAMSAALWAGTAHGSIGLSFLPITQNVNVGATFPVQVFARPDAAAQNFISYQFIFSWNPAVLRLTGSSLIGAPSYSGSGFLHDPYGINEVSPPQDGTGMFVGLGPLGGSIAVPTSGLLLATLNFQALASTSGGSTPISFLPSAGAPVGTTVVYGDGGPNQDVTGTLTGASVVVIPAPFTASLGIVGLLAARRKR